MTTYLIPTPHVVEQSVQSEVIHSWHSSPWHGRSLSGIESHLLSSTGSPLLRHVTTLICFPWPQETEHWQVKGAPLVNQLSICEKKTFQGQTTHWWPAGHFGLETVAHACYYPLFFTAGKVWQPFPVPQHADGWSSLQLSAWRCWALKSEHTITCHHIEREDNPSIQFNCWVVWWVSTAGKLANAHLTRWCRLLKAINLASKTFCRNISNHSVSNKN